MCRAQWRLLTNELAGRSWQTGSRPMRNGQRLMGITFPCHLPGVSTRSDNLIMRRPPPCGNSLHGLELRSNSAVREPAKVAQNNKIRVPGTGPSSPSESSSITRRKKQPDQLDGQRAREHPAKSEAMSVAR